MSKLVRVVHLRLSPENDAKLLGIVASEHRSIANLVAHLVLLGLQKYPNVVVKGAGASNVATPRASKASEIDSTNFDLSDDEFVVDE